ncbi:RNA polymerase sigma-70 factor, ECF subfamily [Pseudarcicella hirudinis]|uniref:RNA polymerase sigma-70 factor, ECF subfamily n=1 Tax=Pseudarcicella hirudinis TaxID=1079859 RepID=A0A1I5PAA4_9BACT|nr:sigma-70 family RNA polymerase sigma factor [Pseudarcicella hirudinis]SFP30720.1 RNA polymerase sigma-70 factor, ECF subfamily [Pseudarcicella hirudinis]
MQAKTLNSEIPEHLLWQRFKEGDSQAFGQIARKHYRILFNYSTKFTKDRELIKDCIQDLFLELWERRENLSSTPVVTIYLLKSIRNNLLKKIRKEKSRNDNEDFDTELSFSDGISIESSIIEGEIFQENEHHIRKLLSQLPKRQQEIIFLKFYNSFSNEEIADIMEMNRQSVANLLYRAITHLKVNWFTVARLLLILLIR